MKSYLFLLTVFIFYLTLGSALAAAPNEPVSDPLSGTSLYETVVKYSEFGDHRTGNNGDIATSKWIADELKKAGLKTGLKPWKLRQFFLKKAVN